MVFTERYKKHCQIKGILPSSQFAAEKLGCTRQNISTLLRTNNVPSATIVINAAKMLEVSTDYLLGLTDIPSPIKNDLTGEEFELLSDFKELNKDGKFVAKTVIKGLLSQGIYKKCNDFQKEVKIQ